MHRAREARKNLNLNCYGFVADMMRRGLIKKLRCQGTTVQQSFKPHAQQASYEFVMNAIYENHLRARTTMIFFLIAGAVNTSVSRSSERSSSYVKKLNVMALNQAALQVRTTQAQQEQACSPAPGQRDAW